MKANQASHPVRLMCRLLGVSASGFYVGRERGRSRCALANIALTAQIHAIHERSRESYGAPRIHAELVDAYGLHVGHNRIARLMKSAGLRGISRRRFVRTTVADIHAHLPADLVDRNFRIHELDRLWVADITYVSTWAGFLYLATVLDACSRKVVGWAMEPHLRTELVLAAINMAIAQRRPQGVIHHSDHGCQGDFQWSSQHLAKGGVVWVDHQGGLQDVQGGHRCGRQAGRVSTIGRRSRHSGCALLQVLRVKRQRWRAACRSHWVRAGSARLAGWRQSVWSGRLGDTCRLLNARNSRY